MNIIWVILVCCSSILLIATNPQTTLTSLLNGSSKAIELIIQLWAIYSFWLGILQIIEDTKLNLKLSKLLSKPIDFIFGKQPKSTKDQISLNISCNMLGMGNASLPSGIKAIELMNNNFKKATNPIITLLILNTCNLQIIPSTIISLRSFAGSSSPANIILPTIVISLICLTIGIILLKIFNKLFKDKP